MEIVKEQDDADLWRRAKSISGDSGVQSIEVEKLKKVPFHAECRGVIDRLQRATSVRTGETYMPLLNGTRNGCGCGGCEDAVTAVYALPVSEYAWGGVPRS
jgi:hypothetical protein